MSCLLTLGMCEKRPQRQARMGVGKPGIEQMRTDVGSLRTTDPHRQGHSGEDRLKRITHLWQASSDRIPRQTRKE